MVNYVAPLMDELRIEWIPESLLERDEFVAGLFDEYAGAFRIVVRPVKLWLGKGWAWGLECPGCREAARVLRLVDQQLRCGRCCPPRSEASKRSRSRRKKGRKLPKKVFLQEIQKVLDETVAEDMAAAQVKAREMAARALGMSPRAYGGGRKDEELE